MSCACSRRRRRNFGALIATGQFHNRGSRLREHINDWAANDDGSITYVTSSLEADSDVTYSVIHYILHHVLRAMDACMEILPFLIDFDYYPMQLWEKTFGRRGFSQYRIW